MQNAIIDRIKKCLALADSPNENEAALAMKRAQELMAKYNVELRHVKGASEEDEFQEVVGAKSGKKACEYVFVFEIARKFFRVEIFESAGRRRGKGAGWTYWVCGRPADIAIAEHVIEYLQQTFRREWQRYRRQQGLTGSAVAHRHGFQMGMFQGLRDKLALSQAQIEKEYGIVLAKDAKLHDWVRERHDIKTNAKRVSMNDDAQGAGYDRGQRIELHKPVQHANAGIRALRA